MGCVSYLFVAVTECLTRGNLRVERLVYSFRGLAHDGGGRPGNDKHEAADYTIPTG